MTGTTPGAGAATPADRELLLEAIALAHRCPPSRTAFSVGAIVVADDGAVLGRGWSRRHDSTEHAEESALAEVAAGDRHRLRAATIYTSLEPCSKRASREVTCTEHILATGIPRIVFAWSEPELFVEGRGAEILGRAGRTVIQLSDLAGAAREPNLHLLGGA
ncbi:deaminase [Myceligenerans xiligouense]|uniref:Diaminohydroxyphosphoribosylaminopyrimidine deaminase n=1 Tax=Myceligenerans xiligouense TaxID=253184 RepID=A0A3N4Z3H3_9MICO|nr:deaminase [Myceligenerans xiligouense]RPF20528.1 diaminohydroxyphosphoribosylaminopyrimidine deaminase [Myceligenerans xiligouense]